MRTFEDYFPKPDIEGTCIETEHSLLNDWDKTEEGWEAALQEVQKELDKGVDICDLKTSIHQQLLKIPEGFGVCYTCKGWGEVDHWWAPDDCETITCKKCKGKGYCKLEEESGD